MNEFVSFNKIARLSREVIVTEKIDGTNAQVCIAPASECNVADAIAMPSLDGMQVAVFAGSRTRWITPQQDNFGFAAWVASHVDELLTLGIGRHFGEWWGSGIQRNYGLKNGVKRFSLFNVTRWCEFGKEPGIIPCGDPRIVKKQDVLPECVRLVPVLWRGMFDDMCVNYILEDLQESGSWAEPGFMNPEGIVVFHTGNGVCFKKTLDGDGHKGQ